MEYIVVTVIVSLMCLYLCMQAHPILNGQIFNRTYVDRSQRPYKVIGLTPQTVTIQPEDGGPLQTMSYQEFQQDFHKR